MRHVRTFTLGILIVCAAFVSPQTARAAPEIYVSPDSHNYGQVSVGDTANMIFNIANVGTDEFELYFVTLVDNSGQTEPYTGYDFAITSSPELPTVISVGESVDIEVTFTPTSAEEFSVYLFVYSSVTGNAFQWIPLSGVGVENPPPVVDLLLELIGFFDTAVTDETIGGSGPGNSAQGRLGAFANMLNAANDLIAAGEIDLACSQLQDALDRCDGVLPPPEFIDGSARETIASKIMDVMNALGCP